jgi:hypothetical protein
MSNREYVGDSPSNVETPGMAALLLSVLIDRLGGSVTITQEEINRMSKTILSEESYGGQITFTVMNEGTH